jgi:hypothetical protein
MSACHGSLTTEFRQPVLSVGVMFGGTRYASVKMRREEQIGQDTRGPQSVILVAIVADTYA